VSSICDGSILIVSRRGQGRGLPVMGVGDFEGLIGGGNAAGRAVAERVLEAVDQGQNELEDSFVSTIIHAL